VTASAHFNDGTGSDWENAHTYSFSCTKSAVVGAADESILAQAKSQVTHSGTRFNEFKGKLVGNIQCLLVTTEWMLNVLNKDDCQGTHCPLRNIIAGVCRGNSLH
jgi:hypothetical protein